MEIFAPDARASVAGGAGSFTGAVIRAELFGGAGDRPVSIQDVTFAPGARTHWHTHAGGQILQVHMGLGLVQSRGGPARLIRPGDTIWFAPGEEHWHGAAPASAMAHFAISPVVEGQPTAWLDPVTDAQYAEAAAAG